MGLGPSTRVLVTYHGPDKADFNENWLSLLPPAVPPAGVKPHEGLRDPCWDSGWLYFVRVLYRPSQLLWDHAWHALSCPEDITMQQSSLTTPPLTTGSYNLSSPSSRMFPGAFRVDGGAGVILLFHLGPKDSEVTMCLCFGQLEVSELTIFNYKKRLLWWGMRTTLSVGTRVNTWKAIWCYVHLAKW